MAALEGFKSALITSCIVVFVATFGLSNDVIGACWQDSLVVDIDGVVKEPRLLRGPYSGSIVYAIMDTMRKLTFKPAIVNGKPVSTIWVQKLAFDVRPW